MVPKHRHASPNSQNVSSASVGLEGRASKEGCRGLRRAARPEKELLFAGAFQTGGGARQRDGEQESQRRHRALEYAVYSRRGFPERKHRRRLPPVPSAAASRSARKRRLPTRRALSN